MAIAFTDSDIYESGSGGYIQVHTFPDIDVSGTDTLAIAVGFNRNPLSDVTSWTIEGSSPTSLINSINTNVSAIQSYYHLINNAATTVVSNTPSFKLQAGIAIGMSGVDQSTPIAGSSAAADGYGAAASHSYTGTAGNLLLVFVSTSADRTYTATNSTALQSVTHADANCGSGFVGYATATGSSQTLGATWTTDTNWQCAIVEIQVASSGGVSVSDTVTVTESVSLKASTGVSPSDTVTVSESVSVRLQSPAVAVSDSVTTSESVGASIVSLSVLSVGVSENVIVSELLARRLLVGILIPSYLTDETGDLLLDESGFLIPEEGYEEYITVSESVSVSIIDPGTSISDTATVTESVSVFVPFLNIATSETITITESISVFAPTLGVVSIFGSDTATVSESVGAFVPRLTLSVSDSTTLSESVNVSSTTRTAVSDTATASESVSFFTPLLYIAVSELIVSSERVTVQGTTGLGPITNLEITLQAETNTLTISSSSPSLSIGSHAQNLTVTSHATGVILRQ